MQIQPDKDATLISVLPRFCGLRKRIDKKQMKFHIIKPWSAERNFGKAINDAIDQLYLPYDSKDWIALMDGDACFLTHDWGNKIQSIIENADCYDLIGCFTNRLRENNQLVGGMFNEMDIRKHYDEAIVQWGIYKNKVFSASYDIAGMFMLFRYSAWKNNKFKENTPIFDRLFTRGITKGRVGIAPGLYVLHMYRLWSNNPKNDSKHLF